MHDPLLVYIRDMDCMLFKFRVKHIGIGPFVLLKRSLLQCIRISGDMLLKPKEAYKVLLHLITTRLLQIKILLKLRAVSNALYVCSLQVFQCLVALV